MIFTKNEATENRMVSYTVRGFMGIPLGKLEYGDRNLGYGLIAKPTSVFFAKDLRQIAWAIRVLNRERRQRRK